MPILYFFLDEAGDRIFAPTASSFFTLTSLVTDDPVLMAPELHKLKHSLIETDPTNRELSHFHAWNDPPFIRKRVYAVVNQFDHYRVDSVSVPKRVIYPVMRPDYKLYPLMCRLLFDWLLDRVNLSGYSRIIVCLAQFSLKGRQDALLGGIKKVLMPKVHGAQRLDIWFHPTSAHPNLQVVDYFAWAIHRARERGDATYRNLIAKNIRSNFLYYQRVTKTYY